MLGNRVSENKGRGFWLQPATQDLGARSGEKQGLGVGAGEDSRSGDFLLEASDSQTLTHFSPERRPLELKVQVSLCLTPARQRLWLLGSDAEQREPVSTEASVDSPASHMPERATQKSQELIWSYPYAALGKGWGAGGEAGDSQTVLKWKTAESCGEVVTSSFVVGRCCLVQPGLCHKASAGHELSAIYVQQSPL